MPIIIIVLNNQILKNIIGQSYIFLFLLYTFIAIDPGSLQGWCIREEGTFDDETSYLPSQNALLYISPKLVSSLPPPFLKINTYFWLLIWLLDINCNALPIFFFFCFCNLSLPGPALGVEALKPWSGFSRKSFIAHCYQVFFRRDIIDRADADRWRKVSHTFSAYGVGAR